MASYQNLWQIFTFFLWSEFFQDKYGGYNQMEGAYITGSFYDCSLVLTPLAGILTVSRFLNYSTRIHLKYTGYLWPTVLYLFQDYVGLRGIFLLASSILTVPVFGLLAFTYVPPLVSTILLGSTYSLFAVSIVPLYPSRPLVDLISIAWSHLRSTLLNIMLF